MKFDRIGFFFKKRETANEIYEGNCERKEATERNRERERDHIDIASSGRIHKISKSNNNCSISIKSCAKTDSSFTRTNSCTDLLPLFCLHDDLNALIFASLHLIAILFRYFVYRRSLLFSFLFLTSYIFCVTMDARRFGGYFFFGRLISSHNKRTFKQKL